MKPTLQLADAQLGLCGVVGHLAVAAREDADVAVCMARRDPVESQSVWLAVQVDGHAGPTRHWK